MVKVCRFTICAQKTAQVFETGPKFSETVVRLQDLYKYKNGKHINKPISTLLSIKGLQFVGDLLFLPFVNDVEILESVPSLLVHSLSALYTIVLPRFVTSDNPYNFRTYEIRIN